MFVPIQRFHRPRVEILEAKLEVVALLFDVCSWVLARDDGD
jgi:hypothetical protein